MTHVGQRGRKPHFDGCSWYAMYPNRHHMGKRTFLYAFGIEGGATKIGMTNSPRSRFRDHLKTHNGKITWVHLFAPVPSNNAYLVERYAHRVASLWSKRVGSTEMFVGLSRADAIACVREAMLTSTTNYRNEETAKAILPLMRRVVREMA